MKFIDNKRYLILFNVSCILFSINLPVLATTEAMKNNGRANPCDVSTETISKEGMKNCQTNPDSAKFSKCIISYLKTVESKNASLISGTCPKLIDTSKASIKKLAVSKFPKTELDF